MIPEGVDYQTRLGQHCFLLRNVALRKGNLEVLANLLQQLALHVCHIATQDSNLIDRPVALEMCHQLYDSLQELSAFTVLARFAQTPQLLIRRRQHLQPFQSRHRQGEIALCTVQALDIRRHVCNCLLGLHGPLSHAFDLLEQVRQLALGGLYPLYAVCI